MKIVWNKLMTIHIFHVYLLFGILSFLFLIISKTLVTRFFGFIESKTIGVLVLSIFFIILGFPGVISIIRKEFVRPIGKPSSGLFAVLGGIVYLTFTYGALLATLFYIFR